MLITRYARIGIMKSPDIAEPTAADRRLNAEGVVRHADLIKHGAQNFHEILAGRALDDGACFSVNPRMLHTKKGREYVRIIPSARLLTETDWPAEDGTLPAPFAEELDRLVCGIAEIRSTDIAELAAILERNSRRSVLPDARKDNA